MASVAAVCHIDREIDGRSIDVPAPLMSLIRAIHEARVGDVAEVLSSDRGSRGDIPAWVSKAGHELIDVVDEPGYTRFVVRKAR